MLAPVAPAIRPCSCVGAGDRREPDKTGPTGLDPHTLNTVLNVLNDEETATILAGDINFQGLARARRVVRKLLEDQ